MSAMKNIVLRIVAVFTMNALGVIGAGAIAGIPLWKAALMAGIGGVATVVEGLARAFVSDGNLSGDEINSVFSTAEAEANKSGYSASSSSAANQVTAAVTDNRQA
ncbi:MAG: hypothetical protein EBT80_00770 [Chitinophagales bacterium]|nr:hypothetical protein [Chitinophagales bacterium]